jgi:hypothetical protein
MIYINPATTAIPPTINSTSPIEIELLGGNVGLAGVVKTVSKMGALLYIAANAGLFN